jgi:hypothetical protein
VDLGWLRADRGHPTTTVAFWCGSVIDFVKDPVARAVF